MSEHLSARADRMARLLREARRKRQQLADLWEMFDDADPASRMSVRRRHSLVEILEELAAAGVIELPSVRSYDRTEHPPAPRFVTVRRQDPARKPADDIVWHSQLAWAADMAFTATQRKQLSRVNDWLFHRRSVQVIPLRERSLEIFGDEKALDAMLLTKTFSEGRLSLDTLGARRVAPRLYTERVGGGESILVVENSDTFDSITRALSTEPGNVGLVAWGAGAGFEASILSIPQLTQSIADIQYFGDLDQAGLRIPTNADQLARVSGLPAVRPAVGLYDALIRRGVRQAGQRPVSATATTGLVEWLEPQHRQAVATLLSSGERMAQEAIGIEHLLGHDDWRE